MFGWIFKKNKVECESKKPVFNKIENKTKYNKSINPFYYELLDENGVLFLFTQKELDTAIKRASKNSKEV